ncbi:SMP-30/gluconolactonase/LRE family protein [Sphingomonas turrisvirgatae]|jgi:gluconolactonase|uniref:SMP-30/gluconolactonase/LRE family protein n=1 Tax=Sphingomonas sp. TaxID=28214 RepID=UPI0009A167C5
MNSVIPRRRCLAMTAGGLVAGLIGGSRAVEAEPQNRIERLDSRLDAVLGTSPTCEVIGRGFAWAEGPTWDQKRRRLYFSDIPPNKMMSWKSGSGISVWRSPAGAGGAGPGANPGTNGLLYLPGEDALLVCDQDTRSILKYALGRPAAPDVVVRGAAGAAFNSPNDLVMASDGRLFFTDPPFGLDGGLKSIARMRSVNGVYCRAPSGQIALIDGTLVAPNGIGLSPGDQHLYVSVSDAASPWIVRYARAGSGWLRDQSTWFDMSRFLAGNTPGAPDGMAIASNGIVFATAPGGVAILTPEAQLLGMIRTGRATGNCCFGEGGSTLFITSDDILLRVRTKVSGLGFRTL